MKTIRYIPTLDARYIYKSIHSKRDDEDTIYIPNVRTKGTEIYLNIKGKTEMSDNFVTVVAYLPTGDVVEGVMNLDYITVNDKDALYDGRFNK